MINKLDFDETIKIRELAEILGISERQIQRLAKEGVIKKNDKGKYLFYQSVKDYIDYLRELESTPQQLQEEKLKNEIDYLKTRDRKEKIIAGFKGQLQTMPYKLAPLVIGVENLGELQEIISDSINSVLKELSEYDRSKFMKNKEYIIEDDEEEE